MAFNWPFRYLKHLTVVLLGVFIYYYITRQQNPEAQDDKIGESKDVLFTTEELSKYDGTENSPGLYLVIMGEVYDVEKGRQHYGPDGPYRMFIGHDASKSFISGDFENFTEESSDISGLSDSELLSLYKWKLFYAETYIYKGKHVGRYFDAAGHKTAYLELILERVEQAKVDADKPKQEFPACNVEWKAETGSRVWCTNKSGDGVERDWVGVPKKYVATEENNPFCVCVPEDNDSENYETFPGCDPTENSCYVVEDDSKENI